MRRKRILKLYDKIMEIVQQGCTSNIEYYNFIDDTITNGDYSLLQDLFITFFNTDITKYNSITEFKMKSFSKALSNTNSYFALKLKKIYDHKGVYQVGKQIFDNNTNTLLGEFTLSDKVKEVSYLGVTYSYYEQNEYFRNTDLFKILDEISVVQLEVLIGPDQNGKRCLISSPNIELIDKYKIGVNILIAGNTNQYVGMGYVFDFFR